MEFVERRIPDFLKIFASSREAIRSFPGCTRLQLLQEKADSCVFFTYSHWEKEDDLNSYRDSDLFQEVWDETKKLFRDRPKAWSLTDQTHVNIHTL